MIHHTLKNRPMRTILPFALLALLFGTACGGAPSAAPGDTSPRDERRADRRGDAEPEMSPEEIAAQEAAAAEQAARTSFEEAIALYNSGTPGNRNYNRIQQLLERTLEASPGHAPAIFNLGVIAQEQGNLEDAQRFYRQAGDADDTFARGLANIGLMQLVAGDTEAAVATFEGCLERNPLEAGCNINLSVIYRMRAFDGGRVDQEGAQSAIDRLRFALGGEARNADAYANLARIYFDLGRLELARLVCENAILLGIDDAVLHNRLGLIALAQDDVIEAYREFQRAVERDPRYVDALMNIGAMALSFRDYEAAHAAFTVVLEEEEDNLDARLAYGVSLRGLEDFEGAEREYRAVLTATPGHAGALFNLGILYQDYHQDYPQAVTYYREFLSVAPAGHERIADVQRRVEVLEELIEILGGSAAL